jgi:hypothetical protein
MAMQLAGNTTDSKAAKAVSAPEPMAVTPDGKTIDLTTESSLPSRATDPLNPHTPLNPE